jgi:hypothetical protein
MQLYMGDDDKMASLGISRGSGRGRQTSCGQSKAVMEMSEMHSLRNTRNNILSVYSQEALVVGCGHARRSGRVGAVSDWPTTKQEFKES